jgi:predicted lipoprotein with Yx(FWY)xxD motif
MKKLRLTGMAGLVAVAALTAACGSGGSDGNDAGAAVGGSLVSTSKDAGLGPILVDSAGKTLYFANGETQSSVMCTGECLGFWTPLTVSGGAAPTASGDLTGDLTTFQRSDGKTQVSYNGHPLYTFKLDKDAGQAEGNNFSDEFGGTKFDWHAIDTDGDAAKASAGSSSGGGYGY